MDESSGYVEVKVWRTGTDLSKTATVTVRSRKSEPVSAEGTLSSPTQRPTLSHDFITGLVHGCSSLSDSWTGLRRHQSQPGLCSRSDDADVQSDHPG